MKEKDTNMAGGMPGNYGYSGPGNIPPPPPAPVKKSGSNGCLIGGLVGCGALLLIIVVGAVIVSRIGDSGFQKLAKNAMAGPELAKKLVPISGALEGYRSDHGGKYPPSLSVLVPKYLPDKSSITVTGEGQKIDYTPPGANANNDSTLVSIKTGDSKMSIMGQTLDQVIYMRLLKDGRIVQDQMQRTELKIKGTPSGSGKSSGDKPDSTE